MRSSNRHNTVEWIQFFLCNNMPCHQWLPLAWHIYHRWEDTLSSLCWISQRHRNTRLYHIINESNVSNLMQTSLFDINNHTSFIWHDITTWCGRCTQSTCFRTKVFQHRIITKPIRKPFTAFRFFKILAGNVARSTFPRVTLGIATTSIDAWLWRWPC